MVLVADYGRATGKSRDTCVVGNSTYLPIIEPLEGAGITGVRGSIHTK